MSSSVLLADAIAGVLADADALVNINSDTSAGGLCADWEGSGAGPEQAGASVGALLADVIAEVVDGADAHVKIYYGGAAEGLCTDWRGSSVNAERAGASVGANLADVIAEVLRLSSPAPGRSLI